MGNLARKIFGTANERYVASLKSYVHAINALEADVQKLSDDELKARTGWLKERIAKGEPLDKIMPDAFATVREASKRVMGMRHFDVQLIGGIVLHRGMIAEMRTGEGKTLVATLAAYLNALSGKGVHVVTVNDYLARRDSEWMGRVYRFLGLSVGVIVHGMDDNERKQAYNADITYATNNELGFDYLRDNMKYSVEQMVQRPFNFAIVDEVDSILIDEARTPLIISGPTEDNSELYTKVDRIIPKLSAEDYEKDEKAKTVVLSENGVRHVEELLVKAGLLEEGKGLYDIDNVSLVHHVNQALRAHKMFSCDVDYIVKDDSVIIIDEFTGRMMEGRRYSEGLHQALEAKENVHIQNENQTLASITFQNYFRLYPKLSGMTGTAMTEANEFRDIYKLEVLEIPTNIAVKRKDSDDEIYRTSNEKDKAVIELVKECHARKQPVLVGTVSIEKSEHLSAVLKKAKIPHNVLNARHHDREAHIVAQAGRAGAVTIATNMAGRGTDIMLGGNPEMRITDELGPETDRKSVAAQKIYAEVEREKAEVLEAGGLYVVGTERHESRRIDNQLRGRSGRQGDPGASKFFLSLEDDLMRIFGSERIDGLLQKMGLKEGEAIFHPWMNKAIEKAQQKVEARNYEIRKNLLKFDDVMNDQRKVIYEQRIEMMTAEDVSEIISGMRAEINEELVGNFIPKRSYAEQWDMEGLEKEVFRIYGLHLPVQDWGKEEGIAEEEMLERLQKASDEQIAHKVNMYGEPIMRVAEKRLLLQTLDQLWKDHLLSLDHLRHGISLRAYGQRDPLNEYKQEAFSLFEQMLSQLREMVTSRMAHMEIHTEQPMRSLAEMNHMQKMQESRFDPALEGAEEEGLEEAHTPLRTHIAPEDRNPENTATWGKISRNEPCPCGSGKKYKHCHGAIV
ncbi:MAG TPA: preprotein translocase subunit SecA [Rickettsiales bacterium]|nr:preprotein translocase subunit SecA [Rickettsiales bacterium]